MVKVRSSTRIAIGFVAVLALGVYGYRFYSDWRVSKIAYPPIEPGKVNLVGVDTSAGFRIVVANQMAQLRESSDTSFKEGSGGEDSGEMGEGSSGDGSRKTRVPVREMLGAMQGDLDKLSRFVSILNDIREDNLPPERVYWKADDIQKALAGDPALRKKLVQDLNVNMDGSPVPELRPKALSDGIVIQVPVPVKLNAKGKPQTLIATVLRPYKPQLMRDVEARYEKKMEVTQAMQVGYYIEESKKLLDNPRAKEDVAATLRDILNKEQIQRLAFTPERVLNAIQVIVNESMITRASYHPYDTSNGRLFDITMDLNGEGSDRLWKYSKDRVGAQLLVVANGIPIAAPRISHELSESNLDIKQLPDEVLVKQAVDLMNKSH